MLAFKFTLLINFVELWSLSLLISDHVWHCSSTDLQVAYHCINASDQSITCRSCQNRYQSVQLTALAGIALP